MQRKRIVLLIENSLSKKRSYILGHSVKYDSVNHVTPAIADVQEVESVQSAGQRSLGNSKDVQDENRTPIEYTTN
jgi:hypothetical protein